jgi:hypothetical protein
MMSDIREIEIRMHRLTTQLKDLGIELGSIHSEILRMRVEADRPREEGGWQKFWKRLSV